MRFAFARDHKACSPVAIPCDVLGVSRGGYYARARRPPSAAARRRDRLVGAIRRASDGSRCTYGSPRGYRALEARGVAGCENTVAELMRGEGVRPGARRPFAARTTDSRHGHPVAANALNRASYPDRPNAVWTADITYVPTAQGWLYPAAVLDLFSRRAVGWAAADHLRAELACDAPRMAPEHRRPGGGDPLHHSDRGVRYAGDAYRSLLAGHGIEPSLSRTGDCWDDAVTESSFSTTKRELTHHESYATREEARRSSCESIEVFYNRRRLHSTLGDRSPAEFEVRFAS